MLITLKFWKESSFKNVSFWILFLQFCFVFGQQKTIVIDPGHGGADSGAIGINDVLEKDVVLNVAKEITVLNKTLFNDRFTIYSTRYTDTLISLKDRGRLARALNAYVFVSLHCNAFSKTSKGIEVYVHTSREEDSHIKVSIALGLSILKESTGKLGFKERGVKFANFQVLRETVTYCPSLLVEMGFMTNIDEADYYLKPKNIRAMGLAILMGLYNYFNTRL
ncbi:N-acetylmuramoyl-L-alanine amidase [Muricauda ruestringensis]|uniref:N-acetylmuramoyl-L-alanine amidase family protein n=1 Tax=Flagellimonas ruestringensis TaxID=111501 RepID=UPI001CD3B8BD|nr:N-acetylmuramoyl-L-alanine amidase [Allomuricauda ruestringensis]MCA0957498.1 N-acetylmuramoyl-L-alanine amidase [Allomuricauda ruestringensis]